MSVCESLVCDCLYTSKALTSSKLGKTCTTTKATGISLLIGREASWGRRKLMDRDRVKQ